MNKNEYDFLKQDRIQKIQQVNEKYDLEKNAYLSFSGGKDSQVASRLLDLAIPDNKIPRVYFNTGVEYSLMVQFVKSLQKTDGRIVIVNSGVNVKQMLEQYGYPFKSKEHSQKIELYQRSGKTKTIKDYLGETGKTHFICPQKMKYNFSSNFQLKVSDKCCTYLKKKPGEKWGKENEKPIVITGIRQDEGGLRQSIKGCLTFDEKKKDFLTKFHPILPLTEIFIHNFISLENIELSPLYKEPFNFKRTGCKGCPYNLYLEQALEEMARLLPAERKQCEIIWGKVYDEYRRVNFRLHAQKNLF